MICNCMWVGLRSWKFEVNGSCSVVCSMTTHAHVAQQNDVFECGYNQSGRIMPVVTHRVSFKETSTNKHRKIRSICQRVPIWHSFHAQRLSNVIHNLSLCYQWIPVSTRYPMELPGVPKEVRVYSAEYFHRRIWKKVVHHRLSLKRIRKLGNVEKTHKRRGLHVNTGKNSFLNWMWICGLPHQNFQLLVCTNHAPFLPQYFLLNCWNNSEYWIIHSKNIYVPTRISMGPNCTYDIKSGTSIFTIQEFLTFNIT